jgi:hypothetical protein
MLSANALRFLNARRRTPFQLTTLFDSPGSVQDGVAITAFGQGQLTGAMYTVPAHGEVHISISAHLVCVTPNDVMTLNGLIRSLLDASHQHLFDENSKTDISGGLGLFCFFSFGVSASYQDTKHTMDSWGLSEDNQKTIVNAMMNLVQKTSDFVMDGTVYNREYDYAVSGSIFGIVMDATIQQGSSQNQVRFLAPNPHLKSSDGTTLPVLGKLY